ncbi:MAG: hypothetical protein Q8P80_00565, partial [Candidatus Levybacteria bacterium]|nr:hypothetical protein [Candidatus Levybacteria bacterium]
MKQIAVWLGVTAIIIGSVFGLIKLSDQGSSSPVLSSTINIPSVLPTDVAIGNPKAKAVLVEYSDF